MTTLSESVRVASWFGDLLAEIFDWSILILSVLLLTSGIVALALNIIHRIRKWRISSNREVIELEERLRKDLERIEKELDKRDAVAGTRPAAPASPVSPPPPDTSDPPHNG